MRNAKVLKKSVVKALRGRSKQELASEDVEASVASEGQVEKSYEQEQKFQSGKGWEEFA